MFAEMAKVGNLKVLKTYTALLTLTIEILHTLARSNTLSSPFVKSVESNTVTQIYRSLLSHVLIQYNAPTAIFYILSIKQLI